MSISGRACVGPVGEAQTPSVLYLTIDITAFKETRKHTKRNRHTYVRTYVHTYILGQSDLQQACTYVRSELNNT